MGKIITVGLECDCADKKQCGGCEFSGDTMKRTGAYGWCELTGGKVMDDDTCEDFFCADCGED